MSRISRILLIIFTVLIIVFGCFFIYLKNKENEGVNNSFVDMQETFAKMENGELVKIACVGDSITFGQSIKGYTNPNISYPEYLESLLRDFYKNDNIIITNIGQGTATTAKLIKNWDNVADFEDHDLIILMVGTNDSRPVKELSVTDYYNNLVKILDYTGSTPVVFLGITPRFKESVTGDGDNVIQFYRSVCEQFADEHNLLYIDMFNSIMNMYKNRSLSRGVISPDGSHYTNIGYKTIAEIIFTEVFLNDDIKIKPNQFKDIAGQWVVRDKKTSHWNEIDTAESHSLQIDNGSVDVYFYLDEASGGDLVIHFTADNSSSLSQNVDVINMDMPESKTVNYKTSPKKANGNSKSFSNFDYAIPVCKLKSGLNRIILSTTSSVQLSGFSVISDNPSLYQSLNYYSYNYPEVSKEKAVNLKDQSAQILSDQVVCSANSIADLFKVVPTISNPTKYRFRAYINEESYFAFGQQATASGYIKTHKLSFDGDNVILEVIDYDGEAYKVASSPLPIIKSGIDIKVDLSTGNERWSIWINDVLVYQDNISLCIGNFTLVNDSLEYSAYVNPILKKSLLSLDTSVIIGEEWITFSDYTKHIIGLDGRERLLYYQELTEQ
jgi:lysophospholipase L1-like esterase